MDEQRKEGLKGLLRSKKFLGAMGTVIAMLVAVLVYKDPAEAAELIEKIFKIGATYVGTQGAVDTAAKLFFRRK